MRIACIQILFRSVYLFINENKWCLFYWIERAIKFICFFFLSQLLFCVRFGFFLFSIDVYADFFCLTVFFGQISFCGPVLDFMCQA